MTPNHKEAMVMYAVYRLNLASKIKINLNVQEFFVFLFCLKLFQDSASCTVLADVPQVELSSAIIILKLDDIPIKRQPFDSSRLGS